MSQLVVHTRPRPNIEEPRWSQDTYWGRAKHFATITNPLNIFCSSQELEHAKQVVQMYRKGQIDPNMTVDELWRAKNVYDSAFHPDTRQKMTLIGRMSAQVPMNMTITGFMMTFYKTTPAVVFWQWINQSFNAVVNYTNRSGENPIPMNQLMYSYVGATGGALVTALGLNSFVTKFPPLIGRFVPWCAVAAANCVNIPLMRIRELKSGVSVYDENGNKLGESRIAARYAISMVTFSRIVMATPGMIVSALNRQCSHLFCFQYRTQLTVLGPNTPYTYMSAPIQTLAVGFFLVFATPMCCALFPQKVSLSTTKLEDSLQAKINSLPNPPKYVIFNKGL
ncbi:unnamed protein product [Soboliphyme baturini]|uniref:Sidoreflexin n=1 Tax=Soboliphyme baturini TaxID=241478 RepID=A0A183IV97_9BILA|nr:unnamed protein product [Soboliphyme baturini]